MREITICNNCICIPMCMNKERDKLVRECYLFSLQISKIFDSLEADTERSACFRGLERTFVFGVHIENHNDPHGKYTALKYHLWHEV